MDVLAGVVVTIGPDVAPKRHSLPTRAVTAVRRRASGGFVIATEDELVVADDALSAFEPFVKLIGDRTFRTNDGGCDPLGGFVVGTMAYDERPDRSVLYRIDPSRRVTRILEGVSISNGVQWSADGSRVFYIDTPTRRVDTFNFDLQTAVWTGRRTHIQIDIDQGWPDGMAIDEEDGLWIALWGGGAVAHYDAAGKLVETIRVPNVSQVSSCAFGGPQLRDLFITTSRKGLSSWQEPHAGAVFKAETAVRGAIPFEFSG
jgi:sugar lactone lactonase YvrE